MATAVSATMAEIEIFRGQARIIDQVLRLNLAEINHEESLIQPRPAGNCMNWVLGHLIFVYQRIFPLLGQEPVIAGNTLDRYRRGSAPLDGPAEALPWRDLTAAWNEVVNRVDAGLAGLSAETLDSPAPYSPAGNPDETVRSLLGTVLFHQAYHTGQAGLLRRLVGKKGAIA